MAQQSFVRTMMFNFTNLHIQYTIHTPQIHVQNMNYELQGQMGLIRGQAGLIGVVLKVFMVSLVQSNIEPRDLFNLKSIPLCR